MANWWNRNYNLQTEEKNSWLFNVEATVDVPKTESEDEARKILYTVLNRVSGDVSEHTAIESNIQFQIKAQPIKG